MAIKPIVDGRITRCPKCGTETGPIAPEDFHCPHA